MMPNAPTNAQFDAAIPGENYTADTKNYPWHREPDLVDYDEAFEYVVKQLQDPTIHSGIMSSLESGADLTELVSTLNMLNISDGKYPIDLSLLIAGPIARYIKILAAQDSIEATIGDEMIDPYISPTRLRAEAGIPLEGEEVDPDMPLEATEGVSEMPTGGLMGVGTGMDSTVAPEGVQDAMLGYSDNEVLR